MSEAHLKIYDMEIPVKADLEPNELEKIKEYIEDWIKEAEEAMKSSEHFSRVATVLIAFLNASIECYKNKEELKFHEESIKRMLEKLEEVR